MQDPAQDPQPLKIPENKPVSSMGSVSSGSDSSVLGGSSLSDSSSVATVVTPTISPTDQTLQDEQNVGAEDLSAAAGAVDQLLASADEGVAAPAISAVPVELPTEEIEPAVQAEMTVEPTETIESTTPAEATTESVTASTADSLAADAAPEKIPEIPEVAETPTPEVVAETPAPELPADAPAPAAEPVEETQKPADPAATLDAVPTPVTSGNPNSILDILLTKGEITQESFNQVSVAHISTGKPIEQILSEKKYASEEEITKAKAEFNGIPFIRIADTGTDPQALTQLPESVARTYKMLPISFDKADNHMVVAMINPLDLAAIDFAEKKSGVRIEAKYATPSELERTLAEHYSQSLSSEVTEALQETSQVAESRQEKSDLSSLSGETIRQAPITKIVHTIVEFAMKALASDIHIEPQESRTRVRYRIDGILQEKLILPASVHDAVVSRIKILSNLKIDEKRIPQDGRFNFANSEQEVDLRVSTLPTIHGEKIVMRLLKKDQSVPELPQLGLDGIALQRVNTASKVPHGIVLVTGPTGSGKTTTLYSVLHKINSPKVNIMTLEDPVEYQMTGVNQVQINPQAGLTFASGLRSFLRQDPNIIMVGEIRDSETAELAVQAALTGHLVFSTLHTSSAAGALPRLLDMGAEPFLLASSITLVMAQRVLRKINEKYKEEYKPEKAVVDDIRKVLGPRFDQWCKTNNMTAETLVLHRCKADRPATEPEYRGRIAIFEVMPISETISKMILERQPASEMEKVAMTEGMLLMKQDGYMKALNGVTTIEEVLRVAQI
ncbi:MAG: Flp pilus assembly complex ATPase component [Candidatus Pacebacteria bacterium]|nr:Flp pilus assembly complex ATPase component [Candidatus Paceibacterota bacterium]PIZ79079.1 MAG: hypothetical protein COY01_01470 [Candidatus Pacebacteria bacterium CG_4_10_14_0_2_um_filter_40_20]PJA69233.1 MAG: hypothetical protein CO156_01365 [Candidatus Pacebacteria bacterium CG_4_9_14_3_um_filter_40_12]PJC42045.1 MAG: hypothetical protein CO041_00180 [Candidatus Pacebacteria bacterium CG_4_9_14_0_2_um_filter_40_15]